MDTLFLIRLSDRPWEVLHRRRKDDDCFTFSANGKNFCLTINHSNNICWLSELAPYDKARVHEFPALPGRPGGYGTVRMELIWRDELRNRLLAFIAE